MKYKVGDVVAIHFSKDNFVKIGVFDSHFDYLRHGVYKKCKILKVKKHWNYFFKTAYLFDDGFWYPYTSITPIIRVYANA